MFRWLLCLVLGGALLAPSNAAAQASKQARFAVRFADGSRAEGNTLAEWHATQGAPKLDGRPLLDANNPMLWLRDRSLSPGPPPKAFVELIGGDCLPGSVVGYRGGNEASFDPAPPHYLVLPASPLRPPQPAAEPHVRVLAKHVRRIVWQKSGRDDFRPGTVIFRDGRSAAFRSARFTDGGVNLLLAEGPRKAAFNDLAELHFPAGDPWDAYFDELVSLGASANTRLLSLETTDGLVVTSTLDRFAAHVVGNPADPGRWVHGLHPAWSLDLLWVPCNTVWMRRLFPMHELPLSRIAPTSARACRVNRNEHGGPLRAGEHDFGWGLGVHAPSELAFPLPNCVSGFRSAVGLDRAVGKGGCIWARVYANATSSEPLYESGFLVGAEQTSDTGLISLKGPREGQKSLVLEVDAAHAGRPESADPLNIRDSADWLDPVLSLDAEKLRQELVGRRASLSPAWKGWAVHVKDDGPSDSAGVLEAAGYKDDLAAAPGAFATGVYARLQPFSLVRELEVGPRDNWLVMAVHQQVNPKSATKFEVLLGGEAVAEYIVPARGKEQRFPTPLAVPLANYRGHKVACEIRQHPASAPAPVLWQTLRVVEQLPTLNVLLDDEGTFSPTDPNDGGEAALVAEDKHAGTRALKLTPAGRFQTRFSTPLAIRERPEWGEFRFVQFAFRKFGKGRVSVEFDQAAADAKPVRYDAGSGSPAFGAAKRVWTLDLPAEWIVMTRDLYSDFGKLDLTGLTLSAVDGDYALFDSICLARTQKDLESLAPAKATEATNQKARRELAKETLKKVLPATVAIEFGEGRFGTGTLITPDGFILTAGHLCIGPNRDVTVHVADGREIKGKTLGLYRELDIGAIKLAENGPWPFVELNTNRELPLDQLFIGAAHPRVSRGKAAPAAHVVGVRRMFRGQIWTDFDIDDFSTGGPLVDKDGRLVGVHYRESQFGGFSYARLDEAPQFLDRIKKGEVFGSWLPGSGPAFGAEVSPTASGARVHRLDKDGPAAKAGLARDDLLVRVKGKPVVSLEDIHFALADSNPGEEVVVEYLRGSTQAEVRLTLAPRIP